MPVSIPYTFTQTDDALTIVAEVLAGSGAVSKATASLLVTTMLVKLNVAPSSLLQLDLFGEVDPERGGMLIEGQRVTISLVKAAGSRGVWPHLLADASMDKVSRLQRRQASLVEHEAREAAKAAERVAARKHAETANRETSWAHDRAVASAAKSHADQMKAQAIESIEELRRNIEENRRKEKAAAEREAKAEAAATPATETNEQPESTLPDLDDGDDDSAKPQTKAKSKPARDSSIWDASEAEAASSSSSASSASSTASTAPAPSRASAAVPAVLAPVRRTNPSVAITFTKDATATPSLPARESTMAQKMAYKATMLAADPQAAAAAAAASADNDARDSRETSPLLLKEKGDKLLKDGDTLGAIAAYTASIEKDTKRAIAAGSGSGSGAAAATAIDPMCLVRAYSNRAAAHLKLASSRAEVVAIAESRGRLRSCIADCSTVLRIVGEGRSATANPAPALVLEMYALSLKALHRQASAYSWLGAYARAVQELQALLSMLNEAQSFRTKALAREEEEAASEHKDSDPTPLPSASSSSSAPALPTLPPLDPSKLQQDIALFESLLQALAGRQDEAYKSEGDRLLAGDATKAIEAYTSALLVHPAHLGALSNRSAAQLAARRWAECVQDATLALALWEEVWIAPKTGLAATAPAPPSAESVQGPLPSDVAYAKPTVRIATAAAIHARVRLVVRRATARSGLHAWMAAQADLQHALALLPLTGSAASPVLPASLAALKLDLDFLSLRLGLGARTRKAAAAFGAGEHSKAVALYTDAIEFHAKWTVASEAEECSAAEKAAASVLSVSGAVTAVSPALAHVSLLGCLLSDRSAAHLAAKNFAAAIQGCSVAMQVWANLSSASAAASASASTAVIPSWTTVTLVRRGSARAFQGDLAGGVEDYEKALSQWAMQPSQQQEAEAGGSASKEQRARREQVAADLQRIRAAAAAANTNDQTAS